MKPDDRGGGQEPDDTSSEMNAPKRWIPPTVSPADLGNRDAGGVRSPLDDYRARIFAASGGGVDPDRHGVGERGYYFRQTGDKEGATKRSRAGPRKRNRVQKIPLSLMTPTMIALLVILVEKTTLTLIAACIVGVAVAVWDFHLYWRNTR